MISYTNPNGAFEVAIVAFNAGYELSARMSRGELRVRLTLQHPQLRAVANAAHRFGTDALSEGVITPAEQDDAYDTIADFVAAYPAS